MDRAQCTPRLLRCAVAAGDASGPLRCWRLLPTAVFAREKSGGERAVRNDADLRVRAERHQLPLELTTMDQVVVRLKRLESRPAVALARREGSRQTPGGVVRRADVVDLALR